MQKYTWFQTFIIEFLKKTLIIFCLLMKEIILLFNVCLKYNVQCNNMNKREAPGLKSEPAITLKLTDRSFN